VDDCFFDLSLGRATVSTRIAISPNPADAVLDVLVWGTHVPINPDVYDPALKPEIQKYLRRAMAYRSNKAVPSGGWSPADSVTRTATTPPADSGPSIFTAIEEQLGLKLESGKGPVNLLVIDSVQRPSEN
jgi:hypothetical protein